MTPKANSYIFACTDRAYLLKWLRFVNGIISSPVRCGLGKP